MEPIKTKHYITNRWKSVGFYTAFLIPLVLIIISIPMVRDFKNSWVAMLLFYPFFALLEFLVIKHWKKEVIISDKEIIIKSANLTQQALWSDIGELTEFLFGQGELFYELKTHTGKKIGFTSSIQSYDGLLREIENHTGLKFKQRL